MFVRILSAVVLAPPLIYLILYGSKLYFFLFMLPVAAGLLYEWQGLNGGVDKAKLVSQTLLAWSVMLVVYSGMEEYTLPFIALVLFSMISYRVLNYKPDKPVIAAWSVDFAGLIYCTIPLILLIKIKSDLGGHFLVFLLLIIWATDSGAYFSGKFFGKRKLAPRLSPGKTWVGFYGGCLGGILVSLAGNILFSFAFPYWQAILIGLFLSLAGQLGDLAESLLKRESGIKDSGNLIPGHGGLLDRLDSVLFAAPVFYILLIWIDTSTSMGRTSFAG
ncbi:MAG: phosphatidate cytidylyltransferase [Magnetococcales bacterium]|nr:phosphatidate cytidylyltransferase [Magnetococcales bacterium]